VVMVENIHRQLARRSATASIRDVIASAASEVDRPIFYAIAVIVAGFLPIYVLSGPSGKLFTPMADTMIYALVGSLLLTLTLLPVLCLGLLRSGVRERRNIVFDWLRDRYAQGLDWSLAHRRTVIGATVALFGLVLALTASIGAEFMPHLDEGALWVRATMPYTISLEEAQKIVPEIRRILRSFPEVTVVTSEHGRPDDGTDATGFFNAEFFVGLKPYSEWHGAYRHKSDLINAVDEKLKSFPGVSFNFTQPAEDNVNEVETGLKSALDVKLFGTDLAVLQSKGIQIKRLLESLRGIRDVTLVQEIGQPSLTVTVDRDKLARYALNVEDVNGLIEAAVGGAAATQVVQGEKLFDLVVRLSPEYRETPEAIGNILLRTPVGPPIPLRTVATLELSSGASFIYRQSNARFIGIQYSVEGRDLASTVQAAQREIARRITLPQGYHLEWGGEYEEYTASRGQLQVVLPITLALIFVLLFALYRNFKFPLITVLGVLLSAPLGGLVVLMLTRTPFSVSSGIGFLALFGVSVQTAVVFISYANELRRSGRGILEATRDAAIVRLRPIMMTALVAALGLLPAALSTGIGSDSQKPFAMVIVGGLFSRLLISIFLMPVLYLVASREGDHLEV
jgi:cobalt-zinc-cadmium resistance protein CzcA